MRPIKFRAYGKNSKEFLSYIENGKTITGLTLKNIQNIEDIDSWDFQQFTGLLDKNGKEIYEGDILSVKMGKRTKMSVIEWVQKSPRYDYEEEYSSLNGYVKFGNFEQKSLHPDGSAFALHEGNFEVIGNIYENPDLLSK